MPKHRNKYRDPVKRTKPLTLWTPENWKAQKAVNNGARWLYNSKDETFVLVTPDDEVIQEMSKLQWVEKGGKLPDEQGA